MPKLIDLTGQVFGRLTVIRQVESYKSPSGKNRDTMWLCRCSCAEKNEVIVTRRNLKSGITRSCGCIRRENCSKRNLSRRTKNRYDLSGEYGIGYTKNGDVFLFDLEDYNKIKNFCWSFNANGYLKTNLPREGKRTDLMFHNLVMPDAPAGMVVDHIIHPVDPKGKKSDNRKSNLRFVTKSQNAQNQIPLRKTNTSGHKGVSWNKRGMWKASISAGGKRHTKYFAKDDFKKACEWYEKMAEKLHGEHKFKEE